MTQTESRNSPGIALVLGEFPGYLGGVVQAGVT